ncbi:dihydrofolate reductase [Pedobacter cryoconitis]|uniref:Dihydrofolate reductase n=1 Tax=Pedobacter cryoconitis TaxID=188932 RepID=A0A7W8ZHV0_9SPHI|nr:dihydrofolate reductase [Pedobacter cryoconitis]MBB5634241.1 dihydrofolate reductase [Pedobacter cryoconitis]MBB6272637.1 dihydrofolate reductase [Pedobacter cryoconitis]
MIVSIIVAIAENHAIGKDNQLLWHLPGDLKHFKNTTSGHTVIMGRKTFDSVGKPLPNRRNIVITRDDALEISGAEVVNTLDAAIALCDPDEEVFIVGGAQIYNMAMAITDKIYLTVVKDNFEADTFFPAIDPAIWKEESSNSYEPDEKNNIGYTISTLVRK